MPLDVSLCCWQLNWFGNIYWSCGPRLTFVGHASWSKLASVVPVASNFSGSSRPRPCCFAPIGRPHLCFCCSCRSWLVLVSHAVSDWLLSDVSVALCFCRLWQSVVAADHRLIFINCFQVIYHSCLSRFFLWAKLVEVNLRQSYRCQLFFFRSHRPRSFFWSCQSRLLLSDVPVIVFFCQSCRSWFIVVSSAGEINFWCFAGPCRQLLVVSDADKFC